MKKVLLVLTLITLSLSGMAQSGQDFASFGDELLVQKNKIQIYPNPSVEFLNVRIENSNLIKTELIVYSIIGSQYKVEIENIEPNEFKIDVRDLPPGYYLLSIKDATSNFSKTYKFLKR
jgi:hypothetical protein